jgi:uncharacterized protein
VIRAVLDSNVILSGYLGFRREQSKAGIVLRRAARGRFRPVTSDHIISEVARALELPFFRARLNADEVERLTRLVRDASDHVVDVLPVTGICPDADDDAVLATALAGDARFVVTGDRAFLSVKRYANVEIVGIDTFLAALADA